MECICELGSITRLGTGDLEARGENSERLDSVNLYLKKKKSARLNCGNSFWKTWPK